MPGSCVHRESHPVLGEIQVWDEDDKRSLWFDDVILQSEIYLNDPAVLPNPINRAMLAHLMFVEAPQSVLLGGCGGGAIARWLHARSPDTQGEAIELFPEVTRIAHEHFDFPKSKWQSIHADIREHLHIGSNNYDFILMDLEESQWTPEWLYSLNFLQKCADHLTDQGVLTLNLICKNRKAFTQALINIRQIFPQGSMCLHHPAHDNILVLAFKQRPDIQTAEDQLKAKGQRWGLEFGRFLKQIRNDNPEWR